MILSEGQPSTSHLYRNTSTANSTGAENEKRSDLSQAYARRALLMIRESLVGGALLWPSYVHT